MYMVCGRSGQRVRWPLASKRFWHKSPCLPSGNGILMPLTLARTLTRTCCEWWCEPKFTWILAGWLRRTVQYGSVSALQLAMRIARGAGALSNRNDKIESIDACKFDYTRYHYLKWMKQNVVPHGAQARPNTTAGTTSNIKHNTFIIMTITSYGTIETELNMFRWPRCFIYTHIIMCVLWLIND